MKPKRKQPNNHKGKQRKPKVKSRGVPLAMLKAMADDKPDSGNDDKPDDGNDDKPDS